MTYKFSYSILFTAVFTALFTLISPAVHAADTEIFEETYQVDAGTRLELENRNGSVTILQWDKSDVKVWARKKASWGGDVDDVEISVSVGKTLSIETIYHVKNPKVSVEYEIHLPQHVSVDSVRTSNGSIEMKGVHGDADLKTSNGSIDVKDTQGGLNTRTSNGSIHLEGIQGIVEADTSNGGIYIGKVSGIRYAETSNGRIEVEIPMVGDDDIRIETSNGAVKLLIAPDLNAILNLRTSNGRITLHDDIEMTVSGEISKTKLRGKFGEGEPEISVKTSNGSISLYQL